MPLTCTYTNGSSTGSSSFSELGQVVEYAARVFIRKYRFDAVFGADRFGSLLQYVQSGCVVSARGESPMSV